MTKIVVIGDLIIDRYLEGNCERISPEAPVPILKVEKTYYSAGGAANVAKNLKALGADVTLFTVFGYDSVMRNIALDVLTNVSKVEIFDSSRKFTIKTRLIAQNQQLSRYDEETTHSINTDVADELIKKFKQHCEEYQVDAVVLSDYNKGVISPYFLQEFNKIVKLLHIKVFADPKQSLNTYQNTFLITPNLKEANQLFKTQMKTKDDVFNNANVLNRIREINNIQNVVITLGSDGACLLYENFVKHFETKKVSVFDVTGAGDTFLAALIFDYLTNKDIHNAIDFANIAASISVTKKGTAVVSMSEIRHSISKNYNLNSLLKHVDHLKASGKKIVFANGCFDVLHVGHLHLLKKAKEFGDFLIVAINSDTSVKKIKGENRPILNQSQRSEMLAALETVDAVVIFSEETPYEILKEIKPDVLVKGSDYDLQNIIGKEFAKETKTVDLLDPSLNSTTKIINKINV